MSDEEMAVFLGIAGKKGCAKIMASLTAERRAAYEAMAETEVALNLWQAGVGPKPEGVIICRGHGMEKSSQRSPTAIEIPEI